MPLKDHFHAPLDTTRSWPSFHSRWANSIADGLQKQLPARFIAEINVHVGSDVEADVAEFEQTEAFSDELGNGAVGGVALAVQPWLPPAPPLVLPATFPDELEVEVRDMRDNARLVAAVELVSPRNKDRFASRRAFAAKCVAYLERGIGLVVADIVTDRLSNLHNEIVQVMGLEEKFRMPAESSVYVVAYRPVGRRETNEIDVWPTSLAVGCPLPLVPLALRGYRAVPLDLEATNADACQRSRI